ncbi:hypothetical protein [Tunturiibacter psychrotolerans]|uniref:hypothetical protein n=1 Tax=Tunturiibacter psychrotolerans TaxID=3069686 RepID=UPI003D1FCA8E
MQIIFLPPDLVLFGITECSLFAGVRDAPYATRTVARHVKNTRQLAYHIFIGLLRDANTMLTLGDPYGCAPGGKFDLPDIEPNNPASVVQFEAEICSEVTPPGALPAITGFLE